MGVLFGDLVLQSAGVLFNPILCDLFPGNHTVGEHMSGCDGKEAEHYGGADVCYSSPPGTGANKIERLQTEGRKRCEASAYPHHYKQAHMIRNRVSITMYCEGSEKPDYKAPDDVDQDGPVRETIIDAQSGASECVSQNSANCAAQGNPEIGHDGLPRPLLT